MPTNLVAHPVAGGRHLFSPGTRPAVRRFMPGAIRATSGSGAIQCDPMVLSRSRLPVLELYLRRAGKLRGEQPDGGFEPSPDPSPYNAPCLPARRSRPSSPLPLVFVHEHPLAASLAFRIRAEAEEIRAAAELK